VERAHVEYALLLSDGVAVVTVRNIGNAKAVLKAVYLVRDGVSVASVTNLDVALEPGRAVDLSVNVQVPPGDYTVKVVTATGVEAVAPLRLAHFEVALTIGVEPPDGGATDPPPGEYKVAAGSSFTARATPNQGYAFSKWLLNGSDYSTSQEVTVTVRGPTSLTAVFTALPPRFSFVYWDESVAGPVGSKQRFTAVIENVGEGEGVVRVEVWDHGGTLVNSTTLALPAGGQGTVELTVSLPTSRGVYAWTVKAVNTATGEVDDEKSFTVKAMDLYLNVRSAICYTPFESLPPGWGSIGGTWSAVSGGVEGNALRGVDNNGGPGRTSVFYWARGIAAYTSLQAVVQVRVTSVDRVYRGIVLLQGTTSTSPLYEVSARPRRVGANYHITLYLRRFSGGRWKTLISQNVAYAIGWYTLYVSWIRSGTTNTVSAVLYDFSGNLLVSVTANDAQVAVNYFGLDVDGGAGLFDNFVLAVSDPRYVSVSGLQQGWLVELRDRSGALVASAVADGSGVARLFVAARPIVANAKVAVKDALGSVVIERSFSEVVGGDEYVYGS